MTSLAASSGGRRGNTNQTKHLRRMTATETRIPVGLEQGADGYFWAHPLGMAACAGGGASAEDAGRTLEAELGEWLSFLAPAGEPVPPRDAEVEIAVDEWIET